MRYCFHCGREIERQMQFCPSCGAKQPQEPIVQQPVYTTTPVQQPIQNPSNANKPKTTDAFCLVGFILSILSVAVLGLIFSIIGYNKVKQDATKSGKGFAIAGILIALIWLAIGVFSVYIIYKYSIS